MVRLLTEATELRALRISFGLTIVFTAAALAVALASDSETMSLEAMSGLVDVLVAGLAVFVAGKVREPANPRYNFGYAKYESLMIATEGALTATVCLSAIASAVKDLLHPEPVEVSQLVIVYSMTSFLVSVGYGLYMRRLGRRLASPIVATEGELWVIEGWLALGVCLAFVAALVMSRIERFDYSAYVDPAVCIVLSLILLRKPFEILRESFLDLVDASPYAETRDAVEKEARQCVERYGLTALHDVRLRKAGRRFFVVASFVVGPQRSLGSIEAVRTGIAEDLAKAIPDVDVMVLFQSG